MSDSDHCAECGELISEKDSIDGMCLACLAELEYDDGLPEFCDVPEDY